MSFSVEYLRIGKSYTYNGNTYQVYGQTSMGPTGYGMDVTSASSYDCNGFTYDNEFLFIWVCRFKNTGDSSTDIACKVELQASVNGTWESRQTIFQESFTQSVGSTRQIWFNRKLSVGVIDDTTTSYRVRMILADSDTNTTRYSTFSISNCPQAPSTDITVQNISVGKSLRNGSTVIQAFWGKDLGSIDLHSVPYVNNASGETTISCSGLQKGHYIGAANFTIDVPSSIPSDTLVLRYELQGYIDGTWETIFTEVFGEVEVVGGYYWTWWETLWIGLNNIWTNTNSYRVRWYRVSKGGHGYGDHYKGFSISNLSINDTKGVSGCLWVEGNQLCYTDGGGYKHMIAHDGTTPTAIGADYAGCIRLSDSGISDMKKINYVSDNGFIYKTHIGRTKDFDETLPSPGVDYSGCLWVDWYENMGFVSANGDVIYMSNGDV